MASSRARAYNGGLGRSPQQGPAAEPWSGGQEAKPLKLIDFVGIGRPK